MDFQIPNYINRTSNGTKIDLATTVFTIWIGTNDVGVNGLFGDEQTAGVSIVDTTHCASVSWVQAMYDLGARNFLLQNMIPLDLVPMYFNQTFMYELVEAGNEIAKLNFQVQASQFQGVKLGVFDSYSLFTDMYNNPSQYLNGTAPLNVLSSITADNVPAGPARDSYLWFDPLHPSEQADRIVAREIVKAVNGGSQYTTWF